jgi:starch-binding outer membrane protein, SusD/RagB family
LTTPLHAPLPCPSKHDSKPWPIMKKYILFSLVIVVLSACSDYLDVKPQSQIDKDILFQTPEGFMEALNGVYSRCSEPDLYGDELTFGLLDVLAQNYSVQTLTDTKYAYVEVSKFNYKDVNFISRRDRIWGGLYNAIGNCNLLLENADKQTSVLPKPLYNLVKGEALGLRAYLHLDVLRMFGPSYINGAKTKSIPYVTEFTNQVTPQLTVENVLDSIIVDLEASKKYLQDVDPILNSDYKVGYTTDGDDGDELPDDGSNEESGDLFFQNRRHRLNYYAVCATLARAYLHRGMTVQAADNARTVIDSKKFPWVEREDFANVEAEKKDRILYPELIFAWSIPQRQQDLRDRFEKSSASLYIRRDPGDAIYETGGVGGEDLRYKQWLKPVTVSSVDRLELQKYRQEANVNRHPLMAPAIRLSEMYYIAAECVYPFDANVAWNYFNLVRLNRGIGGTYEIWNESQERLIEELLKEARKEFYGEGQIFYMYKRLNRNMKALDGSVIPASNDIYVFPMPDAEIEFGQRG